MKRIIRTEEQLPHRHGAKPKGFVDGKPYDRVLTLAPDKEYAIIPGDIVLVDGKRYELVLEGHERKVYLKIADPADARDPVIRIGVKSLQEQVNQAAEHAAQQIEQQLTQAILFGGAPPEEEPGDDQLSVDPQPQSMLRYTPEIIDDTEDQARTVANRSFRDILMSSIRGFVNVGPFSIGGEVRGGPINSETPRLFGESVLPSYTVGFGHAGPEPQDPEAQPEIEDLGPDWENEDPESDITDENAIDNVSNALNRFSQAIHDSTLSTDEAALALERATAIFQNTLAPAEPIWHNCHACLTEFVAYIHGDTRCPNCNGGDTHISRVQQCIHGRRYDSTCTECNRTVTPNLPYLTSQRRSPDQCTHGVYAGPHSNICVYCGSLMPRGNAGPIPSTEGYE